MLRKCGVVVVLVCGIVLRATAQDEPAAPASEPSPETVQEAATRAEDDAGAWHYEIAPYLWWSGVKSTVEYGDIESSSDVSFLDALDYLKFGGLIHAEATNERWGLMLDLVYLKLGDAQEKRIGRGLRAFNIDTKVDFAQTMVELGGFYRFGAEPLSFDALAGARYFRFDTDVEAGPIELSRDKDWLDPFVGGRVNVRLSDRWRFSTRADVGGFGVGSDTTWNVTALLRYRLKENMDLGLGYRYLDVEKSSDSGSYDAVTSGPLLGMSIRF